MFENTIGSLNRGYLDPRRVAYNVRITWCLVLSADLSVHWIARGWLERYRKVSANCADIPDYATARQVRKAHDCATLLEASFETKSACFFKPI